MKFTNKNFKEKNLFILIDYLIDYERSHGVEFDEMGFPLFAKEDFVNELGTKIIPYSHRNDTNEKSNTLICFYEPDRNLYRNLTLDKLSNISKQLKMYKGFVGYDLSIFKDFLYPFQKFYIMANLVISKYFILEGNKMIPNLRSDETYGKSYFYLFNEAPIVCCGTLGCAKYKEQRDLNREEINRYCDLHPKQIVIQYGSRLSIRKNAINFKAYGRKKVINHG